VLHYWVDFKSDGGKKEKDKYPHKQKMYLLKLNIVLVCCPEHYKLNTLDYQGAELIVMHVSRSRF
jgi:hypothetical protein